MVALSTGPPPSVQAQKEQASMFAATASKPPPSCSSKYGARAIALSFVDLASEQYHRVSIAGLSVPQATTAVDHHDREQVLRTTPYVLSLQETSVLPVWRESVLSLRTQLSLSGTSVSLPIPQAFRSAYAECKLYCGTMASGVADLHCHQYVSGYVLTMHPSLHLRPALLTDMGNTWNSIHIR